MHNKYICPVVKTRQYLSIVLQDVIKMLRVYIINKKKQINPPMAESRISTTGYAKTNVSTKKEETRAKSRVP